MGLWELLGVLVVWGVGAGLGVVAWRRTEPALRAPLPVPQVVLAVALCLMGTAASVGLGGHAASALLAVMLSGDALLAAPSDGAWMHAHGARALWFVLAGPWAAAAVAMVVAPHRVRRAWSLGGAIAAGMTTGGTLGLSLVSGMVAAVEGIDGDPVLLLAVSVVSGAANAFILGGYCVAAALGVAVVASASKEAWRQCALGLGIWALCAWLWGMLLTPPDVLTQLLAVVWLVGGWGVGLVLGWRPAARS